MKTAGREHLTANEFREALLATPPGGTFVYFTGELGHDLHLAALDKDPNLKELTLVAETARQGSDTCELALTQRRIDGSIFEYRATKVRAEFRLSPRLIKPAQQTRAAA